MQQKQYENEQYDCGFSPIIRAFLANYTLFYSSFFIFYPSMAGNLKSSFIRGFSSLKSQRKNGFLVRFRMSGDSCVVQAQDLF
jgi:hypothetical protein